MECSIIHEIVQDLNVVIYKDRGVSGYSSEPLGIGSVFGAE